MAQQLIRRQLLSPSTAEFAPKEEWSLEGIDPNTCRMRGWVDAKNAFGVPIRQTFTVIVHVDGADHWTIQYLKFDGDDKSIGSDISIATESDKIQLVEAQKSREEIDRLQGEYRVGKEKARQEWLDRQRQIAESIEAAEKARLIAIDEVEQARLAAIENAKFRTFTSDNGKYSVAAKVVSFGQGRVTLESRDGKRTAVDVSQLSEADRRYIDEWRKSR